MNRPSPRHRPGPLPSGPWIGSQRWADLLFAHWPVPIPALRPHIPARLEIDTYEGVAWIAAVPFRMERVRPRGVPPVPRLSRFLELNLRTYVRVDDRPGVFFFSLDAASPIAVSLARRWFYLPYLRARIRCEREGDTLVYQATRTHVGSPAVRFAARYRPVGDIFHAEPGTLEHFLTERYCLYASPGSVGGAADAIYRADVDHRPWPLQEAAAELDAAALLEGAGFRDVAEGAPHLLFARRLDVRLWPLRRV